MISETRVLTVAWLVLTAPVPAIELPSGGTEISKAGSLTAHVTDQIGLAERFTADGGLEGWRITVTVADGAKPYLAQCAVSCPTGTLAVGDRALAIIKARVTGGEKGALEAKLQFAGTPYTGACSPTTIELSPEWTEYPVLFVVENALPEGKASLTLFCAKAVQTLEVAGIRVLRYGPNTMSGNFPASAGPTPDANRTLPGARPRSIGSKKSERWIARLHSPVPMASRLPTGS